MGKSCRICGNAGQMRRGLAGGNQGQAEILKRALCVSPSPHGFLHPDPKLGSLTHSQGYTHRLTSIHLLIHSFEHINTWICTGDLFLFLLPYNLHTMQYIDLSVQLVGFDNLYPCNLHFEQAIEHFIPENSIMLLFISPTTHLFSDF